MDFKIKNTSDENIRYKKYLYYNEINEKIPIAIDTYFKLTEKNLFKKHNITVSR